jgi:cobalamin-dependent methionine synthase I
LWNDDTVTIPTLRVLDQPLGKELLSTDTESSVGAPPPQYVPQHAAAVDRNAPPTVTQVEDDDDTATRKVEQLQNDAAKAVRGGSLDVQLIIWFPWRNEIRESIHAVSFEHAIKESGMDVGIVNAEEMLAVGN